MKLCWIVVLVGISIILVFLYSLVAMSSLPQWDLKALSDYHKEADDGKKT